MIYLNNDFKEVLEENIRMVISTIPVLKKEYPKFKEQWKFTNDFDFIYGNVVGQLLGSCLTYFKMIYQREASKEEILEIGELVESYFDQIRQKITEKENDETN